MTTAWVSLEGANGVGKTHLGRLAAELLGERCRPLVELPDAAPAELPAAVIAALHGRGDMFLRTGHPRTETLLLAALQVHRFESIGDLRTGQVVLEDRGPHSVAVYQAAVLAEANGASDETALTSAWHILSTIACWRPLPTTIVLLADDPARCLARFEQRINRPALSDERALMARARRVYEQMAAADPGQFLVLDRTRTDENHAAQFIADACLQAIPTNAARIGHP